MHRWNPALTLIAFLVASCRDSTAVVKVEEPLTLCIPPLTVTVEETSSEPRLSWSPRCGATYLEVTSPDYQEVFWIVQGDSGKIAPGVRYGVNPPAYTSRFGPTPLLRGTQYTVRVGVMVEEDSYFVVGEGTFTR